MSVQIDKLSNGLSLLIEPMPDVHTTAIGVWIHAGARFEKNIGLAHFLEHMLFKGTQNRSAFEITQSIERLGGNINAFTGREETAYYVRMMATDTAIGLEVLADMCATPLFNQDDLQNEREVVIQEILQSLDNPEDVLLDAVQKNIFPNNPLGEPILGTPETLADITANHLRKFIEDYYTTDNITLSIAGKIDPEYFIALAKKNFAIFALKKSDKPLIPAIYTSNDCHVTRPIEQLHLCLTFNALHNTHPDFYAATCFSEIFGETMSSRLFQEIRENLGLAYTIQSFLQGHRDCGFFGVYAATSSEKVSQLLSAIHRELDKIIDNLSDDEVTMAQNQLLARTYMAHEGVNSRMQNNARIYQLYGRVLPIAEIIAKIKAVDKTAILNFVKKIQSSKASLFSVSSQPTLNAKYDN